MLDFADLEVGVVAGIGSVATLVCAAVSASDKTATRAKSAAGTAKLTSDRINIRGEFR